MAIVAIAAAALLPASGRSFPPPGYVAVPELSDEFDGPVLDHGKDLLPYQTLRQSLE